MAAPTMHTDEIETDVVKPTIRCATHMSISGRLVRRPTESWPQREGATMKYLLLVCWDAENMDAQAEPDPTDNPDEESFPWLDDLQARGMWVTGDQLAPPRRGRSVRVRDGKSIVTDGPFAETKEAVGGFDIIECGSLEEAVDIAAGHPVAQMGTIEVRPLWGN
jgi:hypothetical protein